MQRRDQFACAAEQPRVAERAVQLDHERAAQLGALHRDRHARVVGLERDDSAAFEELARAQQERRLPLPPGR